MIIARNITIKYGKYTLMSNFSFRAEGITLIVGPNGAGKSSLLRCLAGGNNCSGYIEVCGKVVQDGTKGLPPEERGLVYLPQFGLLIPNLKVIDALSMVKRFDEEVIDILGIRNIFNKKIKELSGGQLRKLSLALVLLSGKKVWLLDEPLAGVDSGSRLEITNFIADYSKSRGATVVWATHMPEPKEVAERVIEIGR